ncbi:unnamed protein product [Peniophora sp. CBMAI 1063]|nr:unnamed protein product [Peniophora sp. CBMAI 1063]
MANPPSQPSPTPNTPPADYQQLAFATSGTQPSTSTDIYADSDEYPAHFDAMEDAPLDCPSPLPLSSLLNLPPSSPMQPPVSDELPGPSNVVLGEQGFGLVHETWSHTQLDVSLAELLAPASPPASEYPSLIPADELDSQPLWGLCPEQLLLEWQMERPDCIDPTTGCTNPLPGDASNPPSPAESNSPLPAESNPALPAESQKRKRSVDSEADSGSPPRKKTKNVTDKENSAVEDGTRGRKGKAVQSATAHAGALLPAGTGEPVERLILNDMTPEERNELLKYSQIWKIIPFRDGEAQNQRVLYRARAIRPSHGGNNGCLLTTVVDVLSMTFPACCGNTRAQSSMKRHAQTAQTHFPRIREHLLPSIKFSLFKCVGGVLPAKVNGSTQCTAEQTRFDAFQRAHESSGCNRYDPQAKTGDVRFTFTIEKPATYQTAHEYYRRMREACISGTLETLEDVEITDQVVATEVMDQYDVVPDEVCSKKLRPALYHCFTEADVKARDVALGEGTRLSPKRRS